MITDQMEPANAFSPKHNFPYAGQPTYAEVAKEVPWWEQGYPNFQVLFCKVDMKSAFFLIWVAEADLYLIVVEVPVDEYGFPGKTITIVNMVLAF